MLIAPSSVTRLAALAGTAVLILTGCGGGGSDSPPAAAAPATSGSPVVTAPAPAPAGSPSAPAPTPAASPAPAPAPAPSPTPAPAPASTQAADISCGIANFQADALRLINARRAAGASCGSRGSFPATTALTWNAALTDASYAHSRDMATLNYFSHTSADGRTLGTRVTAAGYVWQGVGENIAAGYPSVQAVVDGWMASDGHCANVMAANFVHMGLACVRQSGSTYGTYWTMNLGRPR